jgi:plastocyanin
MIYRCLVVGVLAASVAAAPAPVEDRTNIERDLFGDADPDDVAAQRGRELFPVYSIGTKCARRGCSIYHQITNVNPQMSLADDRATKGPVKALEMLALNDDLNTVIQSDSMCTRRRAMARAAGLAAGMALATVNAPAFAAETKMVKMGSDAGQLVFVPDEIKICKGDTVTWVNNKGGPHNVVFDEEAIPSGVSQESISMDGQLGDEGEKFSKKFDVAGSYGYYCEPHRGAGMNANLIVE